MNNDVRTALTRALAIAPGVLDTPRRLEGLLRDLCPEDLREVSVLVEAAERGCVRTLMQRPHDGRAQNALARQLSQDSAMAMRWAIWAIESWQGVVGDGVQASTSSRDRREIAARPGTIWEVLSAADRP